MTSRIHNRLLRALATVVVAMLSLESAYPLVAQEAPPNFIIHPTAKPVPNISFSDNRARAFSLKDFGGKTVLLNIWATWCGPCRKEMPTLDRLQARLGGERFQVIALSIDRAGASAVEKFYAEIAVRHLAFFIDATGRAGSNLALLGLPGTLLIDPEGKEVGRLIGPAEWDSPEMIAFLEDQIAQHDSRRTTRQQPTERNKDTVQ